MHYAQFPAVEHQEEHHRAHVYHYVSEEKLLHRLQSDLYTRTQNEVLTLHVFRKEQEIGKQTQHSHLYRYADVALHQLQSTVLLRGINRRSANQSEKAFNVLKSKHVDSAFYDANPAACKVVSTISSTGANRPRPS